MKNWKQWTPLALAALSVVWILSSFRTPAEKDMQSHAFGRIPIVEKGRHQPYDSFARNALLLIRGKQTANLEPWKSWYQSPKILSATDWGMELSFRPEVGDTRPIFRIDHPDVKALLALAVEENKEAQTDGKHFSWNDLQPHFSDLRAEAKRAAGKEVTLRNSYEKQLVELWNSTAIYKQVKYAFGPASTGDLGQGLADYIARIRTGRTAFEAQMSQQPFDAEILDWLNDQFQTPLVIPPHHPELGEKDEWERAVMNAMHVQQGANPHTSLVAYAAMAAAYRSGDAAALRQSADDYLRQLTETAVTKKDVSKASREQRFNRIEPFYKGIDLSVLAFLFALIYWISPARFGWMRRAAVWLMVVVFFLHLGGQVFRIVQESRPPVTNLYSSAIFIGLMAVLFGLLLEWVFPHGVGVMIAAVVDFSALLIAHHITLREGDTMVMLQAVLDTNFWLATHVVTIALGYSATFVAGFLGLLYVVLGSFTKRLAEPIEKTEGLSSAAVTDGGALVTGPKGPDRGKPLGKVLATMIYAIVCFATLTSFVGTILGGIWADQSWGRFWGWDVKENGALMIVLWNAIILHARWGGITKERGIACLAILGNVVTAWSWFGVNNLGIGLHSYGFTTGVKIALLCFVASQVALALIGRFACDPECIPRGSGGPSGPGGKATPKSEPALA